MQTLVTYPYIITHEDDIFYVDFIDFENCFTDGETLEEAMINAKDVLGGVLFTMIKQGKPLPEVSLDFDTIHENERVAYADVWIAPIKQKADLQAVKKTLTIPKWLNDEAEKRKVNFSNILQTAIKEELGIKS